MSTNVRAEGFELDQRKPNQVNGGEIHNLHLKSKPEAITSEVCAKIYIKLCQTKLLAP